MFASETDNDNYLCYSRFRDSFQFLLNGCYAPAGQIKNLKTTTNEKIVHLSFFCVTKYQGSFYTSPFSKSN
jgi:hypothetical protein